MSLSPSVNPRLLRTAPAHPLDGPRLVRRLAALRGLCSVLMLALVVISAGFGLVVWYVLDGLPLAGRLVTIGGLSVITVATGVLTPLVPVVALWAGRRRGEAGLRELAAEPSAGDEADAERLVDVFAGQTFTEYAVAGGVGFAWAVLFHVTSDPLMLLWVGGLVVFMAVRLPTTARARRWFDAAADRLARERRTRTL
jgi:hypothetical protein